MKRILVVFPTGWDAVQLDACREAWGDELEVALASPSHEACEWDFDVLGFIEAALRGSFGSFDGVLSSSDYPGATVAAAIATRLALPGARPERVIRCSHKYYSRLAQRDAVPEATPPFWLLDARGRTPLPADIAFPCFVKPVKGAFSVLARRIEDRAALDAFLAQPAVREFSEVQMQMFDRLLGALTDFEVDGGHFIAEGLLRGSLVTVEGHATRGAVEILGIVDATTHPQTGSFLRFDYPSSLPAPVQERMGALARRAIAAVGLSESLFNLEMTWDPQSDRIAIVEINPRLCGQFGDLYQKVDGTHGYEVALALALGRAPPPRRRAGRYRAAASFPLRLFAPARVASAPDPDRVRAVEAAFPDTRIWCECEPGQELADFSSIEDGSSARYAVVNLGADDRDALGAKLEAVREQLGFRFEPL